MHSMKDVSVQLKDGLKIAATPPRGDPRDVLISLNGRTTSGPSSREHRGYKQPEEEGPAPEPEERFVCRRPSRERGVENREDGTPPLDAIVLAAAGVERISESRKVSQFFSTEEMVPAAGQATLAVEVREGDVETERIVAEIDDGKTRPESDCERAFARRVGGDCFVPVGACARMSGESLTVSA